MQPIFNNYFAYNVFSRLFGPNRLFQLTGNLYPADIIDIFIIALFIYSLFFLFRQTRTFLVMVGLLFIVALYVIARVFNLYLTSLALQYFFGVSVIMFVIIFQQEIRKYFELVGLIGTRQIKVKSLLARSPSTAEILHSCIQMAENKIGGLIVLQGNDDLDPLIEGGVPLDGLISEEALVSIFDPHSEGHDGALIIHNNRITKFAAHLPLSNNFKEIGRHGTRHSAALGISENSDAFCIVVSEEKGVISICKEGKLKTLATYPDLEKELNKYIKDKYFVSEDNILKRLLTQNIGFKFTALIMAFVIWFFSAYQAAIVTKTFDVPVTFSHLPEKVLIESFSPKEVVVTVSGRGNNVFSRLGPADFSINLDASKVVNGVNKITVSRTDISQPLNLFITKAEPSTILLTAQKYMTVKIPVNVMTKGTPAKGFTVKNITINPEKIDLLVPESSTPPAQISTEIIDISGENSSLVLPVNLKLPAGLKFPKPDAPPVNVAFTIEK